MAVTEPERLHRPGTVTLISTKTLFQFLRYFGAALIGYTFDVGLLILLHEFFNIHHLIAASAGFVAGLLVVYIISSRYVFGVSKLKSRSHEFGLFALIGIFGLAILNILMWALVDQFTAHYVVAKVIATIFVYAWNFFARRALYHS